MRRHERAGISFAGLVLHNVSVKRPRLVLTSLAVAVGVATVVTFSIVNHSLRASELAIMQTGRADFTVAQQGVSDILSSTIDEATLRRLAAEPGVAGATGVLIGTQRLERGQPAVPRDRDRSGRPRRVRGDGGGRHTPSARRLPIRSCSAGARRTTWASGSATD